MVKAVAYKQDFGIHRCRQDLFQTAMLLLDLQVIARIVLYSEDISGKFLAYDAKGKEQCVKQLLKCFLHMCGPVKSHPQFTKCMKLVQISKVSFW